MSLLLVTPPAVEPVTLAEAKAYLRVDLDDEDALISRCIVAAREAAERYTGRAFVTQDLCLRRDAWPGGGTRALALPRPPLIEIATVTVFDLSGTATVLSSDAYIVDSAAVPGRIVLRAGTLVPSVPRETNMVEIAYRAGYGDTAADVPASIRSAILHWVGHLFEHRGDSSGLPSDAHALLAPYRVFAL